VYWSHAAGHAYRRADLLIAVSDYIRQGLLEFLGLPEERVQTIHNGVDSRFCPLESDKDEGRNWLLAKGIDRPFLLSVANLVPVKNLEAAIQAFSRLARCDLQLALAGNDRSSYALKLKEQVHRLGLADQIVFLGPLGFEDLLLLYNHAELLVHPSHHEGFSSSLLEAMACGLPIVGSRTTSIPETAGEAAVYHAPDDVDGLVDCVSRLLGNSDLRAQLSERALQRVQRYTWDRCVQKTLAAYGQLN
jgi:glycosyltransferase involved in cell wall biosynthesis